MAVRLTNILDGNLDEFSVSVKEIQSPSGEKTKKDNPMTPDKDKYIYIVSVVTVFIVVPCRAVVHAQKTV